MLTLHEQQYPRTFFQCSLWAIAPMVFWYSAANAVAYYFTFRHEWVEFNQGIIIAYALITLYIVPWVLTVVVGFLAWGYALRMHGAGKGTLRAFAMFIVQWCAVWAMTTASIRWHYVYFFTDYIYS